MWNFSKPMAAFVVFVFGVGLSTGLNAQEVGTYDPIAKADEKFKEFRENLPSNYEEANQKRIVKETFEACSDIYRRDKAKALTNGTCNSVFVNVKHPEMESFSAFSTKALRAEYGSLTEADKEILKREGLLNVLENQ